MVMQAQSGQTVTLTLSRAGTTLQVPCKLANMAALEALYPPRPGQGNAELAPPFAAAWEKYAQALASAAPGAAAPDVDWDQLVPASP